MHHGESTRTTKMCRGLPDLLFLYTDIDALEEMIRQVAGIVPVLKRPSAGCPTLLPSDRWQSSGTSNSFCDKRCPLVTEPLVVIFAPLTACLAREPTTPNCVVTAIYCFNNSGIQPDCPSAY